MYISNKQLRRRGKGWRSRTQLVGQKVQCGRVAPWVPCPVCTPPPCYLVSVVMTTSVWSVQVIVASVALVNGLTPVWKSASSGPHMGLRALSGIVTQCQLQFVCPSQRTGAFFSNYNEVSALVSCSPSWEWPKWYLSSGDIIFDVTRVASWSPPHSLHSPYQLLHQYLLHQYSTKIAFDVTCSQLTATSFVVLVLSANWSLLTYLSALCTVQLFLSFRSQTNKRAASWGLSVGKRSKKSDKKWQFQREWQRQWRQKSETGD